jgi:hypothetical protein
MNYSSRRGCTCTDIFSNIDPVCDSKEVKYLSVELIQQSNYTAESASINYVRDYKTKENHASQTQYIAIFDVV